MPMGEGVYRLGTKELSCAFILFVVFFFFWRLWYVTSWDKKTLSEFAGGDLFLSSNLDVCPSVLPIPSFSVL